MASYIPLPAYQIPRNALLDLSPINDAIDTGIRVKQQGVENKFREDQMGMQREQLDISKARAARADRNDDADFIGKSAMAFSQLPEGQRNPAAWDRVLRRHPDYANLPPEYKDPVRGPGMVAAEYGQYSDPLKRQLLQAQINETNAQAQQRVETAKAQAEKEARRTKLFNSMFDEPAPAAAPAPAPVAPGYQPMPPTGGPRLQQQGNLEPGVMPGGVTPVADTANAVRQPSQPQLPAQEPTVEVMGRQVPVSRARAFAQRALLDPETAALGKQIMDEIVAKDGRMGKEGANKLDTKQIDAVNHVARLEEISQSFRPEYQQIQTRFGMAWKAGLDKIGKLSPQEAQGLRAYTDYRRSAVNNMSRLLNELSGAAVSEQEYNRIRQTQPDAGTGLLDGDSPQEFQAKLQGARREQLRAIARLNYLRNNGFAGKPWEAMPLEEIDRVIDQRGTQLEQQLKQRYPTADPAAIQQQIKTQLSAEFGIKI